MQNNKLTFSVLTITSFVLLASCTNTDTSTPATSTNTENTTSTNNTSISSTTNTSTNSSTSTTANTSTTSNTTSSNSFSKSATYTTDHGKHQVTATFDITTDSDGKITAITATMDSGDRKSDAYIARFNQGAQSKIVGKKISEISSISAIGGSSDTTDTFVSVIQNI